MLELMNMRKKALIAMITKLYSTKNTVEKVLMTKVSIMAKVQLGT